MKCVTAPPTLSTAYDAAVRIGVPREVQPGESRVALVPEVVSRLSGAGFEVAVERGAGTAAAFTDEAFADAGANLVDDAFAAEGVVKVRKPTDDEISRLREGQLLIAF